MEKKMRISVRVGTKYKDITFPVPEELQAHLLELLKVEDAMAGSAFKVQGNQSIKVRLTTFEFDKDM